LFIQEKPPFRGAAIGRVDFNGRAAIGRPVLSAVDFRDLALERHLMRGEQRPGRDREILFAGPAAEAGRARGTFAATFLLAFLAALELEGVRLEDL
jgi:hypothetical protein